MKNRHFATAIILATGLALGGIAQASTEQGSSNDDAAETSALLSARISAAEAMKAASAAQNGNVAELAFSLENGAPTYEVTIVADNGKEHNLVVDAMSGKVTRAKADDHDKNGDDENGERETGESN